MRAWQSKRPALEQPAPTRFSRPSAARSARYSAGAGTRGTFAAVDETFEDLDDDVRDEGSTGSVVDMNADLKVPLGRWPSIDTPVEGDWRRCSESI